MRRGGGGGGGGGGRGGHGRRDLRPGGSSDDRGRHDRRPDYRPRRSPRHSPRRSPSPGHRARRLRDDDRDRDPPHRGQRDYGRVTYRHERDRLDHTGHGDRGPSGGYSGRGASGRYDASPDYMLPDHPSDLGRPSLRAAEKESEFYGGPGSGRTVDKDRDRDFFVGSGGRRDNKEGDFLGDAGMTLRVSSTRLGRTSAMYLDRRSPPPPLPPPPPVVSPASRYPLVPPPETGFLTGGSSMKARESFGTGSTRLLHDNNEFQYQDLLDPYGERSREIEGLYPGMDLLHDRDGERDRLYSSRGGLGSNIGPSIQLKAYAGSSSSVLAKDHRPYGVHGEPSYDPNNGYTMDIIGRPSHDSLGHGSGHAHRFSERSLDRGNGHDDNILLDITRQTHSKHPPRAAASIEYDAHDYGRRDPENDKYFALRSSPLTGLKNERNNRQERLPHGIAEGEDGFQGMHHDMELETQHAYHGDAPAHYRNTRDVHVRYSHSPEIEPLASARRPVRQHEFASFEDGRGLSDQEVSPMPYGRPRIAAYHNREMDMYQADDSSPGREYYEDDMDNLTPEGMSRSYDMVDNEDGYDAGYDMPISHNVFSRIALPNDTNGEWIDADQGNYPHSDMLIYGHSKYKPINQRLSIPNARSQFGGAMQRRGRGGLAKRVKKRLRTALPQFHGGHTSEKNGFVRPSKSLKLSENHNGAESNHLDAADDEDLSLQRDPLEGSEEFSKQVHQAFLKYTKMLNESSTMQKRYLEASKGSLSCCVCGSVARKFPDIDALISHAYDTCKVGLRTKHLGLHKALCVLMGWNWHVAPETSKAYHSIPAEEVNAMKGDLMLWPPVVVIHNISITNKAKGTEATIVSIEEIEGVLSDIGVVCEKAKVSHGKPANQSVFLVKFLPTISGFQEAMRIHDHFTTNNHGKAEFQQMKGGKGKRAAPADKLEELYGHIAVAEDLGCLDEETKKRCVVRSKNDIEAKADATLNLDP